MDVEGGTKTTLSHLPLIRFTTVATVLVAMESLVCIALWLAGGDSLYLEDSVEKFLFTHSTFDLACLAAVRGIVVVGCLFYLESSLIRSHTFQKKSSRRASQVCLVLMMVVIVSTLIYAVVKGVMVLLEVISGRWNNNINPDLRMSVPYIILSIAGIVFPAVDLVLGFMSWWCVKRMLHVRRIRLLVNEPVGQDDEKSDDAVANNASFKRIILLAKPVTFCSCMVY